MPKITGIIGLAAGAYLGYRFGPFWLVSIGLVLEGKDFWSLEATRTLQYAIIIIPSLVVGAVAYFIPHLFRKFE